MPKKIAVPLGFAFAIWAVCASLIGIGRQFMSMDATLVAHAIGAPVGAAALSWIYFRNFGCTGPLASAVLFVATTLALDVFVGALLIEKSFDMLKSPLGLWLPLTLIFAATWMTGKLVFPRAVGTSQQ